MTRRLLSSNFHCKTANMKHNHSHQQRGSTDQQHRPRRTQKTKWKRKNSFASSRQHNSLRNLLSWSRFFIQQQKTWNNKFYTPTQAAAAGSERRERETRRLEIGEVLRKPKECEWIHLPVKDLADPCWMPRKDDFFVSCLLRWLMPVIQGKEDSALATRNSACSQIFAELIKPHNCKLICTLLGPRSAFAFCWEKVVFVAD